jgi:hypothetical protein
MPRISQDQTQERHAYLLELFRQQPDLSTKDALSSFKDKFGATISPKTLNELRDQAQSEQDGAGSTDEEPSQAELAVSTQDAAYRMQAAVNAPATASAQPAKAPKAKAAKGQRNVFVDAPAEQLVFLERIVQQLQEAGATNVRIDHSTDRWMVLVVDAK